MSEQDKQQISFPSSTLCVCNYCGSTATFYGKPDEINKAAREFYEIHKHPEKDKRKD